MELFRFMSNEEFKKLKNGEILYNDTIHIGRTNSVGFCFLNLNEYIQNILLEYLYLLILNNIQIHIKRICIQQLCNFL